ncbi:MAG: hypothetical protein RMM17_11125 [Acidobacteriota bacterium]|nr:hypothetical protein [Blastocatellia bacterium]MDW8413222.1 hypothetical protein [Acidobacteriota bacterium]
MNEKDKKELPGLEDLREEEVAQAVEELPINQGESSSGPSLAHDRKVEAELKEMFRAIVSQFITPVGKSIRSIIAGDHSERTIDMCIGALKPLIMAAEEIHYNDIYDVLKSIEQPLTAFRQGKKRLLSKKDLRNLSTDYKELTRLISRSVASDTTDTRTTSSAAELMIADLAVYFKDIDSEVLQKLFSVGLTKLGDLAYTATRDIQATAGIDLETAQKLKACAAQAIAAISPLPPRSSGEVQRLENTRQTASLNRHILPAKTGDADVSDIIKERWITAVERITDELERYAQSAIDVITELERVHRALVNMRVACERLQGEVEFYQDDLSELFDTTEPLSDELGTPVTIYRQMLKELRRTLDHISNALRKAEKVYSQIDESLEETQEIELLLLTLRKRKGSPLVGITAARKSPEEEQNTQLEGRITKRLN